MPKSTSFDTSLLGLIFQAGTIALLAQNNASPTANLYVALHTSDPTAAGNQSSNEMTTSANSTGYVGYTRVAVARTSGGWTVTSNSVSPAANITFPIGTGGSGVATYMSIGVAASGATVMLYSGALSPTITCGSGVIPTITSASTLVES